MTLRSAVRLGVGALAMMVLGCSADAASEDDTSEDRSTNSPPIFAVSARLNPARYPFVLVHAFNGSATNSWSFNGVKEALEADGQFVYVANLPPYGGTPRRAELLIQQLDTARQEFCAKRTELEPQACFAQTKVNLIGHSQGGLDARYAISRLGYAEHVASLSTIGTPHRGTPLGDRGLRSVDLVGSNEPVAEALFTLVAEARANPDFAAQTNIRDAFFWLSEMRAADPRNDMKDDARVYYQSWAGIASLTGKHSAADVAADKAACDGKLLGAPGKTAKFDPVLDAAFIPLVPVFSGPDQKPNDGHIPVASAKWGNFRGCVPADHLDLIGRPAQQAVAGPSRTGFDHRAFYRVMASELSLRGL